MEPNELKSYLLRVAGEVTDDALVTIGAKPTLSEKIFAAVTDNAITLGFTSAIVGLFVVALVLHYLPQRRATVGLVNAAPGLLTTMGILGTFFGIFIGLLDFNVDAIDKSVPTLLQGLKIAFVTSIAGIMAAIVLKMVMVLSHQSTPGEEIGPEDIYRVLRDIREGNVTAHRELTAAISGMGKLSVASQLGAVQKSLNDGSQNVVTSNEAGFEAMIKELQTLSARTGNVVDLMERLDAQASDLEARLESLDGQVESFEDKRRGGDAG